MPDRQEGAEEKETGSEKGQLQPPVINLPKGGGAIRGIGEKFAANPVTGTGSMTVPIATSPGRSGFGPQLSLSYDSGAGNGPFGLGWHLSLPSITRKTDKGLPRYQDTSDSDVFILSGAEDLVPRLHENGQPETVPSRTVDGKTYYIRRYRPRIEGLFARIERWTNRDDPADSFWRSISKDNITTWYGKTTESRIFDPADPTRIFSWLICESHDDKGNVISYGFKEENSDGLDLSLVHERNRTDKSRSANRYLKWIRYGNHVPYFPKLAANQPWPGLPGDDKWFFEVVFDYGEHHQDAPKPKDAGKWQCRNDQFSSYRSSFEVRTYRLCQRVLMFHHFPGETGVESNCLVRSTDFTYSYERSPLDERNPIYSCMLAVTQSGYKRDGAGYLKKSLPPLEFEYTPAKVNEEVREVDRESLENLPEGLDGARYQWVDLDGEGLSGILTEQAGSWFYKRNVSALPVKEYDGSLSIKARFEPLIQPATIPSLATMGGGSHQFLDLGGDGQLDVVALDGPTPGFYERTTDEDWEPLRAFEALPNIDWKDPNLKFVDLNGDGHADVLITESEVFTWYPSLAEDGFAPAEKSYQPLDEEHGPRLVFADGTQSIYLADLSGDGLSDLARIRNGEVCCWPNLGYGRFGAKVTMDKSPWFDHSDQFDQKRIRLADIDGSGTTDILYLARDGVHLYFNQSGNSWSSRHTLGAFPKVDNLSSVVAVDLLGNGTACLVWSSPLPGHARKPMRYIDLMGGQKPHLLVKSSNNLGAETRVRYAPSTKFYLKDKLEGKPWITRIPFPVHVVERVETFDWISKNRFTTRYAYHHGYFDGKEREFRGFGMVEQWDTEEFSALSNSDQFPVGDNIDQASHVPPVHTKTWFHTGIYLGGNHVSDYFAGLLDSRDTGEYYREPAWRDNDDEANKYLLDDTVLPDGLSLEEEYEACRTLKGSMLRQEVYALDGSVTAEHPYTVTEQNFSIRRIQPRGDNRHGVFLAHPREAISYHYERNPADPRVSHAITLEVDKYGNVRKSLAIGYGRRLDLSPLSGDDKNKQEQTLITYTENDVTNAIDDPVNDPLYDPDNYRMPLPCEARTYEVTGFTLAANTVRFTFNDFAENNAEPLRTLQSVPYETPTDYAVKRKRLIEHVRTLYRKDNMIGFLGLGVLESLALSGESYKLAFTPGLAKQIYVDTGKVSQADLNTILAKEGKYVHSEGDSNWWIPSGRVFYSPGTNDNAGTELTYARDHFFLPHRYRDPFHTDAVKTESLITYDVYNLLIQESRDALSNPNLITVGERDIDPTRPLREKGNDYRVLQPKLVMDPNRNCSRIAFDALGMVVGTAIMGKPEDNYKPGDSLDYFDPDAPDDKILAHLSYPLGNPNPRPPLDPVDPHEMLQNATTRLVYDLFAYKRTKNDPQPQPSTVYTLAREIHNSDLGAGEETKIQHSFTYSDGFGREIQKKIQAEPGPVPERNAEGRIVVDANNQPVMMANDVDHRWIGSGWTIFNNKGKPVRQYEPFFTDKHLFEFDVRIGVSPILLYDPLERVVCTIHPNHTYEKVVFDPWQQATWDVNDTINPLEKFDPTSIDPSNPGQPLYPDHNFNPVDDPDVGKYFSRLPEKDYWPIWYFIRLDPNESQTRWPDSQRRNVEQRAAREAAKCSKTPTKVFLDSLGREFLTIEDNGLSATGSPQDYETRSILDIEGNQRAVHDAKISPANPEGRKVMGYDYDLLGNRIFQDSMDAGKRWMLNDVTGNPLRRWDSRNHEFIHRYDVLRRPTEIKVRGGDGDTPLDNIYEKIIYGEGQSLSGETDTDLNLRGKPFNHYDTAGKIRFEKYDFKGNLLKSHRRLASNYIDPVRWNVEDRDARLEKKEYRTVTKYDALNRVTWTKTPDESITKPTYNEANLLEAVEVAQGEIKNQFVKNVNYNEKGQRTDITYEKGTKTIYEYDRETFRLIHLKTTKANGALLQDLHYTYDPVGNIAQIEDKARPTIFFGNMETRPVNRYTYDPLYRLTKAEGREHIAQTNFGDEDNWNDLPFLEKYHVNDPMTWRNYRQKYTYDEVGNIEQIDHDANGGDWARDYDHEAANNRLRSTTVSGNNYPYSNHPEHGFMIGMPHLEVMNWNFGDELQKVARQRRIDGGKPETTYYVYDASGQRIRKVTDTTAAPGQDPAKMKERIYLGGVEIYKEYTGTNAGLERKTLHVMDDTRRIAMIEIRNNVNDGSPKRLIRYQFSNHLGSAHVEIDSDERVISYEEYHPYGTTSYQAVDKDIKAAAKHYRYSGKERDEENGLYYHGARYYAPWLGRWCSCDPAEFIDGVNLYVYVRNNPIKFIDPNGSDATNVAVGIAEGALAFMTGDIIIPEPTDVVWPKWVAYGVVAIAAGVTIYLLKGPEPTQPPPTPEIVPRPSPSPAPRPTIRPPSRPKPSPAPRPTIRPPSRPKPSPAPRPAPQPAPRPAPGPRRLGPDVIPPMPNPAPWSAPRQTPDADPQPIPKPSPDPAPQPEPPVDTEGEPKLKYITYTLRHPTTGEIYVGRTRGYGTSEQILAVRYAGHHKRPQGFRFPTVDRTAVASLPVEQRHADPSYQAIRGREQQMIDALGGAWSDVGGRHQGGTRSGNAIRGVAKENPLGRVFHAAASAMFGQTAPYTGY